MSDPERLLDQGSAFEKGLLSAALDEPPPADLLERTLDAVAAAGAAGAVGVAAKAGAAAGAKATGGGILGAIGVGALAGLLTVGAYEVASSARAPKPMPAAPAVVSAAARPIAAPPAPPPPVIEPPATAPEPAPTARVEAAASARPSNLAAELSLLDEARGALRAGDPARARRELDRYAREIPRGQLAREAAVLRAEVEAALDAGKTIP